MDDSEAQFALTKFSRQLWQELVPELPADVEYDPCGTLWVAADTEEMAEVHRKQKYYTERGVRVEVLDAATGQTLVGYQKGDCVIEHQDSVKLPIPWKNRATLPAGQPIRLRFHLQNGDLFSHVID